MRSIAVSRLLWILVSVPVLALAIFGGRLTYESWSRYHDLTHATELLRMSVAASRLAGFALPEEGRAMRGFLAGGGKSELDAARKNTDEFYRKMEQAADALDSEARGSKIDAQLKAVADGMQQINAMRAAVDAKSISPGESTAVLVATSGRTIDLIGSAAALSSDAVLSRRILALYATLQFSNSLLMQRGAGQIGLKEGKLPPTMYKMLAQGMGLQGAFSKMFDHYAPPAAVDLFKSFAAANGAALQDLRERALKSAGEPAPESEVNRWVDLNGQQTNVLNKVLSETDKTISAESEQMLSAALRDMLIYLGVTLVVLVGVVILCRRVLGIVKGLLSDLVSAINSMRDGNFTREIPHRERHDEIGAMARATEGFRENFVEAQQRDAERRAAEDAAQRKTLMSRIAGEFESAIGKIIQAVSAASTELETAARTLSKTAEQTQHLSSTVASASEEASTNVQAVASATQEMTASVNEISRQVQESSRIANDAVGQAGKTDARIGELSQAASRIGDVVKLITAIAEQTNLLALNATIEAARAGEAGKGFAVVAQEVKALAAQTAKATGEIGSQIGNMQVATQDSVVAIKEIGGTIGNIAEIAATIAAAVEEQGAATQEIAGNIQQAAQGTSHVATNITEVNRGAAETGSAAAQVLSSAQALATESHHLRTEVDKFLATVRAA